MMTETLTNKNKEMGMIHKNKGITKVHQIKVIGRIIEERSNLSKNKIKVK